MTTSDNPSNRGYIEDFDILCLTADLSPVPANEREYADIITSNQPDIQRVLPDIGKGTIIESLDYSLSFSASFTVPEPDVFYIDDSTLLPAAPLLKARYPDVPVIFMFSDQRLYGPDAYRFGSGVKQLFRRMDRELDYRLLRAILKKCVDGVLAFSPMCAEITEQIDPTISTGVIGPFIYPDIRNNLGKISPSLETESVITVARSVDTKGIDLLVEAWPHVQKEIPNAQLDIVGPNHPTEYERVDGITTHGYVDHKEIPRYLEQAALFVCPSRFDAHSIAVAEALCAGLPTIVTEKTGAKATIAELDRSLITDVSSQMIADAICDYFSREVTYRQALSEEARHLATRYRYEEQKERFVRSFESLLSRLA